MRKFFIATLSASLLTIGAGAANAMPMSNAIGASDNGITLVAGGCGPGFFRGPYGGCRAMGGFRGPGFRRGPVVVVRPGFRRGYGYGRGRGFRRF